MYCTRKLTEQVWWVGGSDRRLALFENLFPITRGVSYNSYLILDEQTAWWTPWTPPSPASSWRTCSTPWTAVRWTTW